MKLFVVFLVLGAALAVEYCVNDCRENPSPRRSDEMMKMKEMMWADCEDVFGNKECINTHQSITGAVTECINGRAGEYECENIDMLSFISHVDMTGDAQTRGNDMWGWEDPVTGMEYAIVCQTDGTTFVDVSDPENPRIVGRLRSNSNGHNSWRDAKVYRDHVFIISEAANHGMQVFDLTQLRGRPATSPAQLVPLTAQYSEFGSCHNIALDEGRGIAFAIGSRTCDGGPHQVDVTNPTNPTFVGCFAQDGYTHDSECIIYSGPDVRYTGREICFHYNEDTLTIVDHTETFNGAMLARVPYAGAAYTHQGWLESNQEFLLLDDEADEQRGNTPGGRTATYIWDVRNLTNPVHFNTYLSPKVSIDHNQYIRGQYSYMSNYESGLRIVDISNIAQGILTEVASFDVRPQSDNLNFNGAWSSYNYFSSGVVVTNSIERGLFVFKINLPGVP